MAAYAAAKAVASQHAFATILRRCRNEPPRRADGRRVHACCGSAIDDPPAARKFYGETLGLEVRYRDVEQDERRIVRGGGPLSTWFEHPAGNVLSLIEDS